MGSADSREFGFGTDVVPLETVVSPLGTVVSPLETVVARL
jgi:hypothetical protein